MYHLGYKKNSNQKKLYLTLLYQDNLRPIMKKHVKYLILLSTFPWMSFTAHANEVENDPLASLLETHVYLTSKNKPAKQKVVASYAIKGEDPLDELLKNKVLQTTPEVLSDADPLDKLLKKEVIQASVDKREKVVNMAFNYLNTPYKWGGNNMINGFDCSGLVRNVYLKVGKSLPRSSNEQALATDKIIRSQLKPGDLVFFNTNRHKFSHVGIYVGDNKFIHSPRTGAQVRIEELSSSYWDKHFTGARRVTF